MFKCNWCDSEFETYDAMRRHVGRIHKIHSSEVYVATYLNGTWPTCKCGCGDRVKWRPEMPTKFMEYVNGHNSKGSSNPMYGKHHTQEAKDSISTKRKEKFANGEYRVWQNEDTEETRERFRKIGEMSRKENNPVRAKKISGKLKGRSKTPEHIAKLKKSITKTWSCPIKREKQSHTRMMRITENGWQITSKLEDKFAEVLDEMGIRYHRQHYVREIKALYDFYLSDHKIIVEVHGDYWHCNPNTKFSIPKYETQLKNIKNDEKKKTWCELNNVPLLVIWESDLNSDPEAVKNLVLESIHEKKKNFER